MSSIYPLGRQAWGDGDVSWSGDDIKVVLLDDTYEYDAAHEFHDDLTGILATSGNLTGKTNVLGVMDADDVTIPAVAAGDTITQVVIFQDTTVSATSRLLAHYDRLATSVLIETDTDGGAILIPWSNGPTKILRL